MISVTEHADIHSLQVALNALTTETYVVVSHGSKLVLIVTTL
jgi:hypothetical protein